MRSGHCCGACTISIITTVLQTTRRRRRCSWRSWFPKLGHTTREEEPKTSSRQPSRGALRSPKRLPSHQDSLQIFSVSRVILTAESDQLHPLALLRKFKIWRRKSRNSGNGSKQWLTNRQVKATTTPDRSEVEVDLSENHMALLVFNTATLSNNQWVQTSRISGVSKTSQLHRFSILPASFKAKGLHSRILSPSKMQQR